MRLVFNLEIFEFNFQWLWISKIECWILICRIMGFGIGIEFWNELEFGIWILEWIYAMHYFCSWVIPRTRYYMAWCACVIAVITLGGYFKLPCVPLSDLLLLSMRGVRTSRNTVLHVTLLVQYVPVLGSLHWKHFDLGNFCNISSLNEVRIFELLVWFRVSVDLHTYIILYNVISYDSQLWNLCEVQFYLYTFNI